MSTGERREAPYVTVSSIKGLLIGDQNCEWAPWFRAHFQNYQRTPSNFDQVTWKMNHTKLLHELRLEFQADGKTVRLDGQNWVRYQTPIGATLIGRPDLLVEQTDERILTIIDAKTGKPRDSDTAQVMLYMYLWPRAKPVYQNYQIDGLVAYQDHRVEIPASAINNFGDNLNYWLEIVTSEDEPEPTPSYYECRFCDITKADCPQRIEEGDGDIEETLDDSQDLPF